MHMTIAELIRILKINKQKRHTLFLGAGSSLSSGMPTVATCIGLFKKEIFLSEHPDLIDQTCVYRKLTGIVCNDI